MKKLLLAATALAFAANCYAQQVTQQTTAATPATPGLLPIFHPGYIVSNWYLPFTYTSNAGSPANPGSGHASCAFGYIPQALTISQLGVRIQTASAGGNIQLALYNNGSWGRPSTLIASTANISTTTATAVAAAASASVQAGGYWFCWNVDNATAAVQAFAPAVMGVNGATIGSATEASVVTASSVTNGINIAQTFGTWPTWASNTSWVDSTTAISPQIAFLVASVP